MQADNYLFKLESTILELNDHISPYYGSNFAFKLAKHLMFERRTVARYGGSPSLAYITARRLIDENW